METRLSLPFPASRSLALPPQLLRGLDHWAQTPESRDPKLGGPVTDVMAAKKKETAPSRAQVAAVSARLRAMVDDVERWPLPETLLRVIEDLDAPPVAAADGGDL